MNMNKLSVPIAIVIAGAMIAGALYFSNIKASNIIKNNQEIANNADKVVVGDIRKVSTDDHILGNPDAKLIVIEYADSECPYCKMFHTTMKKVMTEYGTSGKVAWVYRHFPIDQLHSKARKESEAMECANDLGGNTKFWEYANLLYDKTPGNNGLDSLELPKIATAVGLDEKAFNTCLNSGKYAKKVEADYQDAITSGGRGTPHSIILSKDGTKTPLNGYLPYEQMKIMLDSLLK